MSPLISENTIKDFVPLLSFNHENLDLTLGSDRRLYTYLVVFQTLDKRKIVVSPSNLTFSRFLFTESKGKIVYDLMSTDKGTKFIFPILVLTGHRQILLLDC